MKVAVVILNWNGEAMLRRFLPTVVRYSCDEAEIWVADNASDDASVQLLREHFPSVRLIQLDKNYGFAEGYNRALAQIEAEYYVLLNSDVEVTHHWLTPLVEYMDAYPDVAACQPKLLSEANRDYFEYAGASGGFIDRYGYPFCRGRIFNTVEEDNGQYDYIIDILWATGACMLIRSADYREAHGLDGRFFAHNEEIDLCWRLRQRGKSNPTKTFLNFRNNLTMLYKNLPDGELKGVMRVRRVLDYVAALKMLVADRSWADFKAVVKARRAFYRWRHNFDDDRREIGRTRTAGPSERVGYSILWQYYVKGRKTFSRL